MAKRAKPSSKTGASAQFVELGGTGLKENAGYINEEFLPPLRGSHAIKTYRQMSDNDPIIGACLTAIGLILRAVKWTAEPVDKSNRAREEADFVESLFTDMSQTWEDFLAEVMSMLVYGWSYHEVVLKRRLGMVSNDPVNRSKFDDGRIGIRKMPIRAQDSLLRWDMQPDGGIIGMRQSPMRGTGDLLIPITRSLLFRPTSRKNSPESVSILRTAYRPWYFLNKMQEIEAIGIERELAGLPVVRIPAEYLHPNAPDAHKLVRAQYEQIARDIKRNEQGGLVIPSDVFLGENGTPSSVRKVDIDLLTSGGQRSIDTDKVIRRYEANIARSVLADFIMLGSDGKGSFALSRNKSDLFLRACEVFNNQIAGVINQFQIPRIWDYNGLPHELMPKWTPGRVAPVDLAELGAFIRDLSGAGAELFPDDELENTIRAMADMPPRIEPSLEPTDDDDDELVDPEEDPEDDPRVREELRRPNSA